MTVINSVSARRLGTAAQKHNNAYLHARVVMGMGQHHLRANFGYTMLMSEEKPSTKNFLGHPED